jgi:hypothetical protein
MRPADGTGNTGMIAEDDTSKYRILRKKIPDLGR